MKTLIAASVLCLVAVAPAFARNDPVTVSLASVLEMPEAQAKLDGSVKFFLAGAKTPKVGTKFGEDTGNARTNAFNKTPEEACRWAALTVLLKFHDHARRVGANAVVGLFSYNQHETFSSATDIQCLDGTFVGGITLKGTYAKIGK